MKAHEINVEVHFFINIKNIPLREAYYNRHPKVDIKMAHAAWRLTMWLESTKRWRCKYWNYKTNTRKVWKMVPLPSRLLPLFLGHLLS